MFVFSYDRQHHSAHRSNGQPCENVFAAIDPTCNRSPPETPEIQITPQSGLPADINVSRRRAPLSNYDLCSLCHFILSIQVVMEVKGT